MLVDEDGDECVVTEIDIAKSQEWLIDNRMLLDCESFGP
jgi:hypothetical protein